HQRLNAERTEDQKPSPPIKDQVIHREQHSRRRQPVIHVLLEEPPQSEVIVKKSIPAVPVILPWNCRPSHACQIQGGRKNPCRKEAPPPQATAAPAAKHPSSPSELTPAEQWVCPPEAPPGTVARDYRSLSVRFYHRHFNA